METLRRLQAAEDFEMATADASLSLARALINTSHLPLLLIDGDLRVIAASRSFCLAFELSQSQASGAALADLGGGEWDLPQVRSLLESALSDGEDAGPYEIDLIRPDHEPRRLVLNVQLVNYDENQDARVLLSVEDVTDAQRADRQIMTLLFEKDDLLREREILLQEMQHRIANSLQIIASVLLLKARAVSSEETRRHLQDAHDRVMSVAAIQKHLELSLGDVVVGAYLTKLCDSLASSMIRESQPLTLDVVSDLAIVSSHEVVSLGLIVTELVINALKHGFPDGRSGHIVVRYDLTEPGWTLSVTDDGVGRAHPMPAPRVGLGTSVVEALARQLHAHVVHTDASPGCKVSIVNTEPSPPVGGLTLDPGVPVPVD